MGVADLDEPGLRRPTVGDVRGGVEHGGNVVDTDFFLILFLHVRADRRALPALFVDPVGSEYGDPEGGPFRRPWLRSLGPGRSVIVHVVGQREADRTHVGGALHLLGRGDNPLVVGHHQQGQNGQDEKNSYDLKQREGRVQSTRAAAADVHVADCPVERLLRCGVGIGERIVDQDRSLDAVDVEGNRICLNLSCQSCWCKS